MSKGVWFGTFTDDSRLLAQNKGSRYFFLERNLNFVALLE
jgi:hypothetical protein